MLNSNQKQEVSRYDLKRQLEGIQSFDISSFGESKNQSSVNIKGVLMATNNHSLFPTVDAPTLQLLEDSQYNIRYLDSQKIGKANKNKKYPEHKNNEYYGDLTARNHQTQGTYQYQQRIENIEKQLEKTLQKLQRQRKQNQLLHEKINLMDLHHRKTVEELKQRNKEQRQQIKALKQRQIKSSREKQLLQKQICENTSKNSLGRQSRAGSIASVGNSIFGSTVLTTSFIDDPSLLCPQLLSPEETVTLLSKLLKKVSKSSKMIKQLTDDQSVKTILNKIDKR